MFYPTVADPIPKAEEHQYLESAEIALAAGFLTIFVFSDMLQRPPGAPWQAPAAHLAFAEGWQ